MTKLQIEACYDAAIDVVQGKFNASKAAAKVSSLTGLNSASAQMYLHAVIAMINGTAFGMNINEESIGIYLERIKQDFGEDAQKRAAESVLEKFLKDTSGNKYLKSAMKVLTREEANSFIEKYRKTNDIWPIGG